MHPVFGRLITKRNVLILCAVILAAFAFWYFSELQGMYAALERVFAVLVDYNATFAMVLFTALAAASAVFSFFTSTPLIPPMTEAFGKPLTLLLIVVGWLIGGVIAYWICYALQDFVRNFSIFRKADYYRHQLEGQNEFVLILLFRLAVPAEIGSYALGLLRYPFWKYVLITFLGELPFAVMALYSTNAFIDRQPLFFIGLIIAGLVAISLTLYLFYRRLRKSNPQIKEDAEA